MSFFRCVLPVIAWLAISLSSTAWPDDSQVPPLVITQQPLFDGSVDRNQYGQFIEYLCDVVPSMWAEKLYDGSFEGLSPYKFHYVKETDFKEKPWYPIGATNRAEFALDSTTAIS